MSRILFWIALIALVIMAVRSKLRAAVRRSQMEAQQQRRPAPSQPAEIEAMTQCAHCGMYFPSSEAVRADGLDYCSPGHVRLPPR